MTDLQIYLHSFHLSSSDIERLKQEARTTAVGCGKNQNDKELSEETWELFSKLSENLWESEKPIAAKIELGFQLFECFPSYFHFLLPFYRIIKYNETEEPAQKKFIWKKMMEYLGASSYYSDPVAYVLWVDFFEDPDTVKESWQGLLNFQRDTNTLLKLIEVAGPVPFELKEPVYDSLIKNKSYHKSILNSLAFSAGDVYGKINYIKAEKILSQLTIEKENENYRFLKKKINENT